VTGRAAVAPATTGRAGMTAAATTRWAGVTASAAATTTRWAGVTATAATTWRARMTAATAGRARVTATTTWRAGVPATAGRAGVPATAAATTTGWARVPAAIGCDGTGYGESQRGDHHARAGGSQQATDCDRPGTGSAAHRVSFRPADAGLARRIGALRPEVALEGRRDASNGASGRCFPSTS
jgi:hypothetical protein